MPIYSRLLFPAVLDGAMGRQALTPYRRRVLAAADGRVLEIGFGLGHNLCHYPASVVRLAAVEPHAGIRRRSVARLARSGISVDVAGLRPAGTLPYDDATFDTVVCTWVLCSVPDPAAALREVARVLRRGGQFLFVEHGLSLDASTAKWQRRVDPVNRFLGNGCRLTHDPRHSLSQSPLRVERCDVSTADGPRLGAQMYEGRAVRD